MLVAGDRAVGIAGFKVADLGFERARQILCERLASRRKLAVFFANAHFITVCRPLRAALDGRDDVLTLNDGVGINLAGLICGGRPFKENLNGTDFLPRLLSSLGRPVRVFLLGSQPASVQGAAFVLAGMPDVTVAGWRDGYSFWSAEDATIAAINAATPDILLVALGCPVQERWILDHAAELEAPLVFGVGALFDFMSRERQRAPRFVRRLNLEWVYRLVREPHRLAYRYTVELVIFGALVLKGCTTL